MVKQGHEGSVAVYCGAACGGVTHFHLPVAPLLVPVAPLLACHLRNPHVCCT
jgi:hypothetical protein